MDKTVEGPLSSYLKLCSSGKLEKDYKQVFVLDHFHELFLQCQEIGSSKRKNFFGRILSREKDYSTNRKTSSGIYLHGSVGTGKSMLMDLFFNELKVTSKRRMHFHTFMQEVHQKIDAARGKRSSDPIKDVAEEIAKHSSLICLDELQIDDITDAMLVGRLFIKLFELGLIVITTSNRRPLDLYKDGLNRHLFLPFVYLITEKLNVIEIPTKKDYRKNRMIGQKKYFFPNDQTNQLEFDILWSSFTGNEFELLEIAVGTRKVVIPAYSNGIARINFSLICGTALGSADYLSLTKYLRVLFLEGVPVLSEAGSDSAKRFTMLIDTIYDAKIQLICLASAKPEHLYTKGSGSFEFDRTISRLHEMLSEDWPKK